MEKDLQSKINDDIRKEGWGFFHREKGAINKFKSHNSFKYKDEKATWPDLLIFPGFGYSFFVELKDKGKKMSDSQEIFKDWSISMDYHCYCIDNWEQWEFVKMIEKRHYKRLLFNRNT
jgi:hypothetical protein